VYGNIKPIIIARIITRLANCKELHDRKLASVELDTNRSKHANKINHVESVIVVKRR
jgi:hypothetical protein